MKNATLLLLLISQLAYGQEFTKSKMTTKIQEVTVFLKGAQITRHGELDIKQGKTIVAIKGLSPHVDGKSIQVKGEGDFTILSVNHKYNYIDRIKEDEQISKFEKEIKMLESKIEINETRLSVLKQKERLLLQNMDLGGQQGGATMEELRMAVEFYDSQLSAIKKEEMDLKVKNEKHDGEIIWLEKQISKLSDIDELPTCEIEIRVSSEKDIKGEFQVSYLVGSAGWFPKYDIRVKNINEPMQLTYKADVFQNTGIDWKNVRLKFSNANPNQSSVSPSLSTWLLNYARYTTYSDVKSRLESGTGRVVSGKVVADDGEGLPGVNVIVKGTTVGTTTDLNGYYHLTLPTGATRLVFSFIGLESQELAIGTRSVMDVSMDNSVHELSEVVVTAQGKSRFSRALSSAVPGVRIRGYSSLGHKKVASTIATSVIENQTTVEFEIKEPYSINSEGETLTVDLTDYEIETLYEYYAVPKLDKDAFLVAKILNWGQYNLLQGEANLYFEDAYVGRTVLDAKVLNDTLDVSLGRDKNIVIGRTKINEYTKRKTVGSNRVDTRAFKIIARNKKSEAIKLTLLDQLPVSVVSDISVTPTKLSRGELNEATGEVKWELEIEPQQQETLELGYEVRYPKRELVSLE